MSSTYVEDFMKRNNQKILSSNLILLGGLWSQIFIIQLAGRELLIQSVNECCNYEEDGAACTVCSCDTDDCNGASMTQISTLPFIAVVLLSFMSQ